MTSFQKFDKSFISKNLKLLANFRLNIIIMNMLLM